jgi:hypothetical protein
MCVPIKIPPSVTNKSAYLEGRIYALGHDDPPCHGWLKDRGHGPLAVLDWMLGYRDEKWEQGWADLIDWRGSPCICGRPCK